MSSGASTPVYNNLRLAFGSAPALWFEHPVHVWAPVTLDEALAALREADAAIDRGNWIAGGLTYEFGAQLLGVNARPAEPLLLLGAFEAPAERSLEGGTFAMPAPLARVSPACYAGAIERIVEAILAGEVYQVNYTVPFDIGFTGDPLALYALLAQRAQAPYSAMLQCDRLSVLAISPELFLRFEKTGVSAKPMKGTAALDALHELNSEKNRAEHLMIVDLLRNDLHRLSSDVRVERLFEEERYPTFATMTSTIRAYTGKPVRLLDAMRAAFPCGSVTGAPKRAAIQHIAVLEDAPRGFYTGTLGYCSPQRTGWWNVPIRTLQISGSRGRFDAGGGIVADSQTSEEWDEVLLKSSFLKAAYEPFTIWETFSEKSDRGAHLARMQRTARSFAITLDAAELASGEGSSGGAHLIRLRAGNAGVQRTCDALSEPRLPVQVCIAQPRVRSDDPFLAHKTSWRPQHEAAAQEAQEHGCFDALLRNERGEITEGTRTNVFARIGQTLYTPPLSAGVLPGILRSQLVSGGQAEERALTVTDLFRADALFVGNSARGLLPARLNVTQQTLYPLILKPKLTPAIWGGSALVERYGKNGDADAKLGESWECWDENTVENGAFEGRSLAQLREELGAQLIGDLDAAHIFPILTKIIDAHASLSVQVHPDDAYAQRVEHQANGKTECWYILDALPDAQLVMGWTRDTTREEYERRVADGSLGDILHRVTVKAGQAFYIPAGTLHAIGAGIVIFETQQASDLTYRIFDWNRTGPDGKPRELHVQKAADVLDYRASTSHPAESLTYTFEGFQRTALIADAHFFVERVLATETPAQMHTHGRPVIVMSQETPLELECEGGTARLVPYQTALVPSGAQWVSIRTEHSGAAPFLCVTPSGSPELLQQRFMHAGVAQPSAQGFLAQFESFEPA